MKTDQEMVRWALEESSEPVIKNPYLRSMFAGGQLVQPGPGRQGYDGREKPLAKQIKEIYAAIKKEKGRNPYIVEVMEKVTLDKSKTLDNKRVNIKEVLKRADLELTPGMTKMSKEARIQKAGESIKQTKRVENFLPDIKKDELFADIKKYRKGVRIGPDATMNIKEFAKYFPKGTSDVVISRQVNRVANEILKLPDHPVKGKAGELEAKRTKYKIVKKGDPKDIFKKITQVPGKHRHHMRAKGFIIDDMIKAISPSLADITHLDIKTNSELFQNVEKTRNAIVKEQMELVERKPNGWKIRLKQLNFKSRHLANKMPKNLKGLMYFEQMDEAGNLKPIGGDPMKSLGKLTPEGKIPFDATKRAVPIVKKEISKAVPIKKAGMLKTLGKRLTGVFGPTGMFGLTAGLGVDPKSAMDRMSIAGEAAFAPELVKASIGATKGMKNRGAQKVVQQLLNLGLPTQTALRVARVAQPLGLLYLGGEGLYHMYKKGHFEKERMMPSLMDKEAYAGAQREDFNRDQPMFAEGGIASLKK